MSNFKGWTSENFEALEQAQLERRLDKAKPTSGQIYAEKCRSNAPAKAPRNPKATKPKGESANAITANVIRCINMQPKCVAYRINNVGIWDEKKQIHRRANTQKGIFDISATIKGRSAWFEIKAGYDKPSQDQLIFQQEVIRAGGIAEFIRSTDEFQKLFTVILLDL